MKYDLLVTDEGKFDILDAFFWYETQRQNLGARFEISLDAALNVICLNPLSFQIKYKNTRVKYIGRFPYGVHYVVVKNTVIVIGVFHTSRNPQSWEKRLI